MRETGMSSTAYLRSICMIEATVNAGDQKLCELKQNIYKIKFQGSVPNKMTSEFWIIGRVEKRIAETSWRLLKIRVSISACSHETAVVDPDARLVSQRICAIYEWNIFNLAAEALKHTLWQIGICFEGISKMGALPSFKRETYFNK